MTARNIEERYKQTCERKSNINEHLPKLRELAEVCDTVTEFGVYVGRSTTAFLAAQPLWLHSYDKVRKPQVAELQALAGKTEFAFHHADVLTVEIEPTDLLFIDSYHTYDHIRQELALHAEKARLYLAFHDTVTFGQRGEDGGKGIWPAIEEYLLANPYWKVIYHAVNNNGLTVLQRDR